MLTFALRFSEKIQKRIETAKIEQTYAKMSHMHLRKSREIDFSSTQMNITIDWPQTEGLLF